MRVDTTPQISGNRKSIRIHSKKSYNFMLLVMDTLHMPTGCATWPCVLCIDPFLGGSSVLIRFYVLDSAFWTNGPDWPVGGEIDILEGVNDYTNNQATIHTASGCHLPTDQRSVLNITGDIVGGTNCAAYETGNQGCGVRSRNTHSYGKALNDNGGGVFASAYNIHFFR